MFQRERVFHVRSSHPWAGDNPHAIREHGHQFRFSWAGIVVDIVVGRYLFPDRLSAQKS
jgi:hypothetical protein